MKDDKGDCPDDCWDVHANLNLDSTTCECPCHRGEKRQDALRENPGIAWALDKIEEIFREAYKRREASGKESIEVAYREFFKPPGLNDMIPYVEEDLTARKEFFGDEHIAANHRGDDPATIGSFPCDCAKDLKDKP